MAGFSLSGGIGWRVKGLSFKSEVVKQALDKVEYHALRLFGADVRSDARKYLERGHSPWGVAPNSKKGSGLLRAGVLYGFDQASRSVVVGPQLLSGRGVGRGPYPGLTVPELLEEGGTVRMRSQNIRSIIQLHVGEVDWAPPRWGRPARYRAMPYMGPAFENRLARLDKYWADSIKKYG